MMEKIAEWITSRFQHPLSLLFFVLGTLLALLGVTTGIQVPILNQLAPDINGRWVALILGVSCLFLAILIYYRPPQNIRAYPPQLPKDLTLNFTQRRAGLTNTQSQILALIERQGFNGELVIEETIQSQFDKIGKSELFYRLETLRLLGFIDRQSVGRYANGADHFAYTISKTYQQELGDQKLAVA